MNHNHLRHRALAVLAAILTVCLLGCATKTQTVKSYEALGKSLTGIYNQLKPACDAGRIDPEGCQNIKDNYNQARRTYIEAGDMLEAGLTSGTTDDYEALTLAVTGAIQYLTTLAVQYGVIR